MQGNTPDPAVFAGASIWEKLEREKKAARSHIIFFAVVFALLFGWMCFYFTQTAIEDRVELFNNDYNHRDELLATRNRRGSIYASDSETLLASTQTDIDDDGNVVQIRSYPFGSMYAHVVGYAQLGGSGGRPMNDVLVAIENVGNMEIAKLEKGFNWLATTAAGAPMIGFLGTVTGMVQAFFKIASAGAQSNVSTFASGIYQALVTTVAGLIVGILALFAYNYLTSRVNKVMNKLEGKSMEFMDLLNEPAK